VVSRIQVPSRRDATELRRQLDLTKDRDMYNSTIATTRFGPVRGLVLDDVHVFKGIRYGKDTGAHRFLPPRPPEPWTDVHNAFAFGPTAPQDDPDTATDRALNPFLQKIGLTDNLPESEDCLFLNVWTPAVGDGGGRPVMVWVHSGAFATNSGSSPAIDGSHLARTGDVVVLTFNHRLNALGYSHLTDDRQSPFAGSGNVGMLDVVQALKWVRDNVAEFGGDPGNVTIFGQSGGAMKVATLLAMPAAAGLFHKAIMQSGAMPRARTAESSQRCAATLMEKTGVAAGDLAALQRADLRDLMRAYQTIAQREGLQAFGSVVDGVVLPADPFVPEASPLAADIPVIVGDLDTEATLFLVHRARELAALSREDVAARLAAVLGEEDAARIVDFYATKYPTADSYEIIARIVSVAMFSANTETVVSAKADQGGAPVWRYRITWRTPVDGGILLSPHEADVALTFGNVDTAIGLNGGGADAHRLSEILTTCWLAFARTGSPLADQVRTWPPYETQTRPTLTLAPDPGIAKNVDGDEFDLLRPHLAREINWLAVF
jgi:para-nitrobenzyl esterase